MVHENCEPDDFLEGLSLGVWDEEFGYYRPKRTNELYIPPILGLIETFTEQDMINEIRDLEEPDITTSKDMKRGEW